MICYWFSRIERNLRYDDGRVAEVGVTHRVDTDRPLALCEYGLHASKRAIDALNYTPGPYAWKVKLSGEIVHGDDKSVAYERTYLVGFDATDVLREFARKCAFDVVHLWDAPDVAVRYLKTGDPDIRDAAWAASWPAADAAWGAGGAAAGAAAGAARSDAWAAAKAAARDAARAEAEYEATDAQNRRLAQMLSKGFARRIGT